jgi:hypothetical protein
MEGAVCPVAECNEPHPLDERHSLERLVVKKGLHIGVCEELQGFKIDALGLKDVNSLGSGHTDDLGEALHVFLVSTEELGRARLYATLNLGNTLTGVIFFFVVAPIPVFIWIATPF